MTLPKGATNVVEPARNYVQKHGRESLGNVAKLHFKTTLSVI
jgi:ribonuclease HIII